MSSIKKIEERFNSYTIKELKEILDSFLIGSGRAVDDYAWKIKKRIHELEYQLTLIGTCPKCQKQHKEFLNGFLCCNVWWNKKWK